MEKRLSIFLSSVLRLTLKTEDKKKNKSKEFFIKDLLFY